MKRRGFSVLELLIIIGLMGTFGLVSQRLFVSSIRTMQTARAADTATTRFDHAVLRLRADTWSASEIAADGASATLKQPGGAVVTWRFAANGDLSRSEAAGATTSETAWPSVTTHARFSASGPSLVLSVPEGFAAASSNITFISQLQLAGGAP